MCQKEQGIQDPKSLHLIWISAVSSTGGLARPQFPKEGLSRAQWSSLYEKQVSMGCIKKWGLKPQYL